MDHRHHLLEGAAPPHRALRNGESHRRELRALRAARGPRTLHNRTARQGGTPQELMHPTRGEKLHGLGEFDEGGKKRAGVGHVPRKVQVFRCDFNRPETRTDKSDSRKGRKVTPPTLSVCW